MLFSGTKCPARLLTLGERLGGTIKRSELINEAERESGREVLVLTKNRGDVASSG